MLLLILFGYISLYAHVIKATSNKYIRNFSINKYFSQIEHVSNSWVPVL